jgi:urease accessory protein
MRNTMRAARTIPLAALALTVSSTAALAHVGDHLGTSLVAGLAHPFTGLDHVLAMVAVGLWASQLGRRAMLLLPAVFPFVMALGAVMGVQGMTLPLVEAGIVASMVVLGTAVALGWRVSVALSSVLVGTFALFHGYAHGAEFGSGSALLYGAGFVLATLLLHLIGLGIGALANRSLVVRTAGGAIATAGLLLIVTL